MSRYVTVGLTVLAGAALLEAALVPGIVIGGAVAMSSTAIIIAQLTEQAENNRTHGRIAVAICLFQDLSFPLFLALVSALSGSGGTRPKASFGFAVSPTTLVRASMDTNTDAITLQPNTYVFDNATNTADPAYINPDGTSAAYMEQDYYLQNNALVGDKLVFAGYCSSNSLDPKYTARAWIKVSQDWSVEYRYDTNLVAGQDRLSEERFDPLITAAGESVAEASRDTYLRLLTSPR